MKTYRGYFSIGEKAFYTDEVNARFKWMAYVDLRIRNRYNTLMYVIKL